MDGSEQMSKRQLQALQTRENLLNAGRAVFLEKGFQKATMTQINKLAHTGYGTAYVYFKNKDDLFTELMETIMQKMYDVAGLPFHPRTKEEAYAQILKQTRLFMQSALEEKEMMKVVKEAIGVSAIVKEKWNSIRARFISGITKDIQFVQDAGLAIERFDAALIAKGWFYMNEQVMWDLVLGEIEEDLDAVSENLSELYAGGLYK
ncbi:MAG TPA: TetR/AcrR family transcriptional regulator [Bacillus bacterium]|uniref:TetR family transcriptional regulator n=1 Tax=Siminovitchia fordii TaxID=254759 RepID=A0ABQ4K169_9BACI|nr:TetR/AcrR family transcriptional regulator [Siminovitchia fordii]GIN19507.1 TetR family transcriptional regulator [Siminovitchia fordii]HBZ11623.1 TetR/AcrR family transcriptional regulator [Bacillus sp. (in: firmicutes)]